MLSGDGNGNKNSRKKKSEGLISKNTTLHAQHTFYVHFFAVVLHDLLGTLRSNDADGNENVKKKKQ